MAMNVGGPPCVSPTGTAGKSLENFWPVRYVAQERSDDRLANRVISKWFLGTSPWVGRLCRDGLEALSQKVQVVDVKVLLRNLIDETDGLCHSDLIDISCGYRTNHSQPHHNCNNYREELHHPNQRWPD
jgi:hypothetical protein